MKKTSSILLALLAAGSLLILGCAQMRPAQSAPPQAEVAAKPVEPSASDQLVTRLEDLSDKAENPDLTDEQAEALPGQMDAAMAAYFAAPPSAQSDPRVQGALVRMCDAALQLELDANAAPETPDTASDGSPKDELLHVTTFLSPTDLKSTYEEVEKASAQVNLGFDVETNNAVLTYVNLFQNKLRDWFTRALTRGAPYIPRMKQIFKDEGVPPALVYLAIVESAFNPNAVSRARAVGMWQFISGTAKRYDLVVDYWEDQRRDPEMAARAAAKYLKDLYGLFNDWHFALAAYNCGEGKIQRYLVKKPGSNFWKLRDSRFLRRETREYVPAIMAAILLASNPQAYGFEVPGEGPPRDTATVNVDQATDLRVLAKCANVPVETLQALNPSLKRLMTPPRPYELRIPANDLEGFQARLASVPTDERLAVNMHTVTKGESLHSIARKYKVNSQVIRLANRLRTNRVAVGQTLVIPIGAAASDPSLYAEDVGRIRRGTRVYRVRRGDTLSSISRRSGVPVYVIKALNDLDGDFLRAGQRLILSNTAGSSKQAAVPRQPSEESAGPGRVHHVQSGDTLWDLARKYGTTVDRICRANRISPGHRLHLGDTLVIP
jgi:membrane-bound lytic murein transglycosylase D